MQDEKSGRVDQIRLGREARIAANTGFEIPDLSTLRAETKAREKHLDEQKKEIDEAIKSAKAVYLPKKTQARFDREFGKAKEKNAFKTVAVLFVVAIIITFFMQPSIFFIKTDNDLRLVNYSERELKNVSIYSFNEFVKGTTTPLFFLEKMNSKTSLPMINKETAVLLAFADRQMPAIGVYTAGDNQNLNNLVNNNNYKTQPDLQEMLNEARQN